MPNLLSCSGYVIFDFGDDCIMPELPEVETIKRDLNRYIKGKIIYDLKIKKAKFLNLPANKFKKALLNRTIKNIKRRAKLLIFELIPSPESQKSAKNSQQFLVIHLKMTGQLIYQQNNGRLIKGGHNIAAGEINLPNKYTHLIFTFTDASRLFYNDLRQFGWLKLLHLKELRQLLTEFGPEPLSGQFISLIFEQILCS